MPYGHKGFRFTIDRGKEDKEKAAECPKLRNMKRKCSRFLVLLTGAFCPSCFLPIVVEITKKPNLYSEDFFFFH